MLTEIFMAVILIITLVVIFTLIKNLFGAIFKIVFGLVILAILISVFVNLNETRTNIRGNESLILIEDGDDLVKGFRKSANELYTEISANNFTRLKEEWNESKIRLNKSIAIIQDYKDVYANKTELNITELNQTNKESVSKIIKNKLKFIFSKIIQS